MVKKRIGCLLLLLTTVLSGLPLGCSNHSTEYKDFLVIDVFDSRANFQGIQSGWFAKIVKDKFNMQLNIIAPNITGGGDTLYETRVAAGDLGDLIICGGGINSLQPLVNQGLIIDLKDYLANQSIMEYEKAIRKLNDPINPGAIYAIPTEVSKLSPTTSCESTDSTYGPYMRYDLYKQLGSPRLETLEDILPLLKDMQALYPYSETGEKTYGFSFFPDWDNSMMTCAKQPACFYGYDECGFVLFKADGSDYQSILAEDSLYMRILKLYFDANQMGLVDPESATQSYSDMFSKYETGQILYSPWPWLGKSAYNTKKHMDASREFLYVPIEDLQVLSAGCKPTGTDTTILAVGSKCEDPQRMADFINWLYSPEGIYANGAQPNAGTPGPEGLTWENTAEGPQLTEYGQKVLTQPSTMLPEEWGGDTWENGVSALNVTTVTLMDIAPNGYPYYYNLWDSYQKQMASPLLQEWQQDMNATNTIDYLTQHNQLLVMPGNDMVAKKESSEIATIRNQCKYIIIKTSWEMIFAESEEEFFEKQLKLQTICNGLGYDEVLQFDLSLAKEKIAEGKKQ